VADEVQKSERFVGVGVGGGGRPVLLLLLLLPVLHITVLTIMTSQKNL